MRLHHFIQQEMSVNRELQFMARLEGHELERELLDVVSILYAYYYNCNKEVQF